jgi:UDP-N-acetyl-D-glucosamine dehydrogenase
VARADLDPAVARVEPTRSEVADSDAVVLLTDHDEFTEAGIGAAAPYVLDCRRILAGPNVETL